MKYEYRFDCGWDNIEIVITAETVKEARVIINEWIGRSSQWKMVSKTPVETNGD